ncbi:aldehyde dehydrogenase (NADP(+)) [Plantactinospora sp. KBS50]|uniref:aldehyde dehydrogenase (NADP(+)) n=1 Tax=Plantactinospora sp. KBS50 TaxID=2024580 RepID=UPI000BAB0218|nr:aldehyde dehydrogenase (NADP(+)) [Plantactinospora sp. KBS50]ASW55568.1 aldehyde dehydrogenase (NADP(+)) [Plantactinospora sp. KBS50]
MAIPLTGHSFIGGARRYGRGGTQRSVEPASGRPAGPEYGLDDGALTDEACRLADDAFDAYRGAPGRARFLAAIADNLDTHREQIVHLVVAETALPESRARSEHARTTGQLRMFAAALNDGSHLDLRHEPGQPDRQPAPRPDLRSRRIPIGTVAVFGASNFPLAFSVAGGDTAAALAAGCPVVVKAHPAHPRTSEATAACVAAAARATGMPAGVFSLVYGRGNETGERLVADPHVAAVAFTGSRAGGLALTAIAQRRPVPIPVFAEMSSTNPVFLLPARLAARPHEIAAGFLASLTSGAGQFCTNPGLLIAVAGPGLDEFRAAVAQRLADQPAQTMLTAGIAEAYRTGLRHWQATGAVRTLAQGRPAAAAQEGAAAMYETTAARFLAEPRLRDEVFGAASLLVVADRPETLPELAHALDGQLTATMHADPADRDLAAALLPRLERRAGRILVNGWPTGVEVNRATVHGGPFPATSDGRSTSVGTMAIERFLRPVAYQDLPPWLTPTGQPGSDPSGQPG